MRGLKLVLPLAALAALAGATFAVASQQGQHTDLVTATISAARVSVNERTCTGDDGQYRVAWEAYAGLVTGDPRLSGAATIFLTQTMNTTTGRGTYRGVLAVTDATTRTVKVRAAMSGVITNTMVMHGLIDGTAAANGSLQGGSLVANFMAYVSSTTITGIIGGAADNLHPAIIQNGACSRPPPRPTS